MANLAARSAPIAALLAALLLTGCASGAASARRVTVSPATPDDLAAILTQMPAANAREEDLLSRQLLDLGAPALRYVCSMVGEWGSIDDTAGRYALGSMTRFVSSPTHARERETYAAVLVEALATESGNATRAFLIEQLQLVGGDQAVESLGQLLLHDRLGPPAARALQAIGSEAASRQLIAALEVRDGPNRVDLINALGQLRSPLALELLLPFAEASDRDMRRAAWHALANLGTPAAVVALSDASATATGSDRSRATEALLLASRRRLEADDAAGAASIARGIFKPGSATADAHVQIAALQVLYEAIGADAAPEIHAASQDSGAALRQEATRLNRRIRDQQMMERERAEGFDPLFNGIDLDGWVGNTGSYVVEDGKIVVDPRRGGGGNLYTEEQYRDFVLRFEFKLTPGANNGLGIRAPLEGDAAYVGMEIQILDDAATMYEDLHPYQYHGSIYGVVPAKRGHQKPVGEWNSQEVIVRGRRVTVVLNDTTIVDADLDEASASGTMDGRDHPGLQRETGHIGFLGHGDRVEFRNIRIKELVRKPSA